MTPITPPLKTHGGKGAFHGKLARWIVSLMPPCVHYVEPFFGGGAVLLARDPEGTSEVANDLNGDLTGFWRVLQGADTFERFRRVVAAVPLSEAEWQSAGGLLARRDEADPVRRAVAYFVSCRQSLAGRMDNFAPLSRGRTRRGMNEQASAWLTAVEGLAEVHGRLKRVAILNRPALEVIRQQDGPGTLFYCDCPYLHETRATTKEYGPFEMSEADHRELLDALRQCRGKVILSGYPSRLYDDSLRGWDRHTFEMPNNAASGAKKGRETEERTGAPRTRLAGYAGG
jgi:DNA adenine methylase